MSVTGTGALRTAGAMAEAEARFRAFSETLAVRLRWLSLAVIPVLAYASGAEVSRPWFEGLVAFTVVYNLILIRELHARTPGMALSFGTAVADCVLLLGLSAASGGLRSPIAIYTILAMTSVCMRVTLPQTIAIGTLYTLGFVVLGIFEGGLVSGFLPVMVIYLVLTVMFVSPLVYESRKRFAEVVAGREAQRELLHRLLHSGEEERRRIASDLHDRGGGALFAMLHGLRRIRDLVARSEAAPRAEVDRLIQVTETMVRELRTFIADLRPNVLDDLGLAEALRELLSRERALSGIRFSLDVEVDARPDADTALAFYRIAQEALTNIRRHAEAKAAMVRFQHERQGWMLEIADDGEGSRPWVPGMGVRTMHERVEALGGNLVIAANNGAGTRISAWVPDRGAMEIEP